MDLDLDCIPPAGSTTRKVEKEVSQANAAESKVSINEKVVQFRQNERKKGKVSAVEPTSGPQAAAYPKNKGSSVVSLKLSASMRQEAQKDNSASGSHTDLNPAAKSKTSEYEKKGEVKVPDPSNLKELHQLRHQKSILQAQITNQANTISEQTEELYTLKSRIHQLVAEVAAQKEFITYAASNQVKVPDPSNLKELHQLRHQKSILQAQITNQANTISEQTEELYTLKSRIHQLVAEVAAQKEFITYAASNQLKKCEMDRTKMEMIVQNVLADVLYDLLKLYKKNLQERNAYDVTKLYDELKTLDIHIPSYGWGSTWKRIKKQHTAIGDDIERIRLIRNELQHSAKYEINGKRYNVLRCMIDSLLERLDNYIKSFKRIKPSQLNSYLEKVKKIERVNVWSV